MQMKLVKKKYTIISFHTAGYVFLFKKQVKKPI